MRYLLPLLLLACGSDYRLAPPGYELTVAFDGRGLTQPETVWIDVCDAGGCENAHRALLQPGETLVRRVHTRTLTPQLLVVESASGCLYDCEPAYHRVEELLSLRVTDAGLVVR